MMMMGGVSPNPGIHGPPWSLFDDGLTEAALSALQLHLSSNESHYDDSDEGEPNVDSPIDVYSCDEFRIYEFKVRRCERVRSHDWTECPYAHPGERARRRDPRKYHYCGTACPDFRKSGCRRGDSCEFAHGVFESWLHPARYRTQPCKDGTACRRRVCFFAHTPDQLRVLPNQQSPRSCSAPESYDGSPLRRCSVTPPSESGSGVNEMMASLRQLQLSKVKSLPSSLWGVGFVGEQFGSPSSTGFRMDFYSLPSTPTGAMMVDSDREERVESGRALRARMVERLRKEMVTAGPGPDVGWVSELVI